MDNGIQKSTIRDGTAISFLDLHFQNLVFSGFEVCRILFSSPSVYLPYVNKTIINVYLARTSTMSLEAVEKNHVVIFVRDS
jgi:hypothetical protein